MVLGIGLFGFVVMGYALLFLLVLLQHMVASSCIPVMRSKVLACKICWDARVNIYIRCEYLPQRLFIDSKVASVTTVLQKYRYNGGIEYYCIC